jgi:hypothetical protein
MTPVVSSSLTPLVSILTPLYTMLTQTYWPVLGSGWHAREYGVSTIYHCFSPRNRYNDDMKLAGIIYLQEISDPDWLESMNTYCGMFNILRNRVASEHMVFATTKWTDHDVTKATGDRRERELSDQFRETIPDQRLHLQRFQNTHTSAWEIIDLILGKTEDNTPQTQKELVDPLSEMSIEGSPEQRLEDDKLYDTSKANADTGEVEEAAAGKAAAEEKRKVEEKPKKKEGEKATQLMADETENNVASTSEPKSDPLMAALSTDRSEGETQQTAIDEIPRTDIVKEKSAEQRKAEEMRTLARKDCADDSIFVRPMILFSFMLENECDCTQPAGDLPTKTSNKRNKGRNSRSRRQPPVKAYAAVCFAFYFQN